MLFGLTGPQLWFCTILVVAFALLLTEKLRNDLVGLLIILALALTGVLKPGEAVAGFSSEPAIIVVAIFVLAEALQQTGIAETAGRWIGKLAGRTVGQAILVIVPAVAVLSAFTHHVATTALMLPITLNLCRERGFAPSKLLLPLSIAASLGTTITIIGAPAFIVASAALQQAGRPGLSVFSIAPIGLVLSLAGTLFLVLTSRWLLPERGDPDPSANSTLDEYFTELIVQAASPLLGYTLAEVQAQAQGRFAVTGWLRGGRFLPPPFTDERVRVRDVLLVRTTPDQLAAFRAEAGWELHSITKFAAPDAPGSDGDPVQLVQAILAPNTELVGRTLVELDFRRRYDAVVVGVLRRGAAVLPSLAQTRLHGGDVLVLQGEAQALARLQHNPAFLLLVPFAGAARLRGKAPLAATIMLGTIIAAALNVVTLQIAMLAGAVLMVLTRCVTRRQAYAAIDARMFVFIAGAIPLGAAMQQTGVSALLAAGLSNVVGGWNETAILLALFALVAVITQFMSDAATTALFAPLAVALAQALGHAPEPYVVTVAMAAVAAFLTPIGHHGNLLVYGPGRYRFSDFVKLGTPLTIIVGVIVVLIAPLLWR